MLDEKKVMFHLCNLDKSKSVVLTNSDGEIHYTSIRNAVGIVSALLKKPDTEAGCLWPRECGYMKVGMYYGGFAGGSGSADLRLEISTDFRELQKYNRGINCVGQWEARKCLQNLAAGKCKDPFIRKEIGEVLFPEHYGPQKTR